MKLFILFQIVFLCLISSLAHSDTWVIKEQSENKILLEKKSEPTLPTPVPTPPPTPTPIPLPPSGVGTEIKTPDVEGVWVKEKSPYYIFNNVNVPKGKNLTIFPGVTVIFKDLYKMTVNGTLVSDGTVDSPILFTAEDKAKGWYGLRWESNSHDTSAMNSVRYTIFEYGNKTKPYYSTGYQDGRGAGLFVYGVENIQIENNVFRFNKSVDKCGAVMLLSIDAPISFKGNVFENNSSGNLGGAICFTHGKPQTVIGGSFVANKGTNFGAIYTFDTYVSLKDVVFTGNIPNDNGGDVRKIP